MACELFLLCTKGKLMIGIILTSIERDALLFKSIQSILDNLQSDWMIIIGYQSKNKTLEFSHKQIYSYTLPYNCGLAYAKNDLVLKAVSLGCDHVLLTADSICFEESMVKINTIVQEMEQQNYDLIGLNLRNRIPWEGLLKLIPNDSFEIDFINLKEKDNQLLVPCDIVRNFWIANINSITKIPWDNNLLMCGHMEYFWRLKQSNIKIACTNLCNGLYIEGQNTPEYTKIRRENFKLGQQRVRDKYSLKSWVSYKNLESAKEYYKERG